MQPIRMLSAHVAVTGSIDDADIAALATIGFRSIVSARPDGEEAGQIPARRAAVTAWRNGLAYRHVPVEKHEVFDAAPIAALSDALAALPGPVLLHCKSGQRAALLWAAASALSEPLDCVMAALRRAGFDFEDLRHDIGGAAGSKRWLGRPAALACSAAA